MVTFTGFLVDRFCWELPGHVAIDGARLETRPQDHFLHCISDIPACRTNGLLLLEKYDDNGVTKFREKYAVDAEGVRQGLAHYDKELAIGDRKITEMATVTGMLVAHTNTLNVVSVEFGPAANDEPDQGTIIGIVAGGVAGAVAVVALGYYVALQKGYIGNSEVVADSVEVEATAISVKKIDL